MSPELLRAQCASLQRLDRQRTGFDWRIAGGLGVLVLIALWFRLPYFTDAFFGDEVSTYVVVHGNDLSRMMQLVHSDQEVTPPLYFLLASLTQHLGDSSDWLRLPPMLGGLAGIPLTYALGQRTVGRPAAMVGAALVGLSPFLIFYSTEARNYGLSMAICLGSTLALVRAIDEEKAGWWALYAVLVAAAMYTHYSNLFLLVAQAGWVLVARPEARLRLLAWSAGAALLFVPWLPGYFEDQNSPGALVLDRISPFGWRLFHTDLSRLLMGAPYQELRDIPGDLGVATIIAGLAIGAASCLYRAWRAGKSPLSSNTVLIVVLACSSVAGLSLYSLANVDVFAARNMINIWPAWALLAGAIVTSGGRGLSVVATVLVLAGFALGAVKFLGSDYQRPDYDGAARYLDAVSGPDDPIVDAPVASPGAKQALEIALADIGDTSQPVLRVGISTLAAAEAVRAPDGPGQFVKPPIPPGAEIARQALAEVGNDRLFLVTGGNLDFEALKGIADGAPLGKFIAALPADYQLLSREHFSGLIGGVSVYELGPAPPG